MSDVSQLKTHKGAATVHGKVKWFSAAKGYGFIVGDDGVERHFAVRDVQGADSPGTGDIVAFEHEQGKKGPRATNVTISARAPLKASGHSDERVTCPHCGKKMIPRIITDRGSLSKSVCPFCGGTYKDFGWCFIASAVYGSNTPEVVQLRRFRDNVLRPNAVGRLVIAIYYAVSPRMARIVSKNPVLANIARRALNVLLARGG